MEPVHMVLTVDKGERYLITLAYTETICMEVVVMVAAFMEVVVACTVGEECIIIVLEARWVVMVWEWAVVLVVHLVIRIQIIHLGLLSSWILDFFNACDAWSSNVLWPDSYADRPKHSSVSHVYVRPSSD